VDKDPRTLDFGIFQQIFSIVVVDLVLSGDNAVVIGMAARNLSPENRQKAILWGGVGAVVLRIAFTVAAALLLHVPFIQAVGGLLLIYIAYKLAAPETPHDEIDIDSAHPHARPNGSLAAAIKTIILADAVMSLDNILAVGGAANGHLLLLLFGLGLSIPILLFGSNLVAQVMQQHPWLLLIGVLVLVHSAVTMFFEDAFVHDDLIHGGLPQWELVAITAVITAAILGLVKLVHGKISGLSESPVTGT
jgi:YjbE family integral membrane protein